MIRQMLNWNSDVELAYNEFGLGEVAEPNVDRITKFKN